MLMPESASNFGIALLNDGVAYHGHLLFGLTFNGPWLSMMTAATQICCRSLTRSVLGEEPEDGGPGRQPTELLSTWWPAL